MKFTAIILSICCLLIISCKSNEVLSPKEFEGNQLWLTHGGGFAGTYKTYCLLENGQLFKSNKQFEASNPVKGLGKKVTNQIFSNYETLGLGQERMESYDNLNYSIIMVGKDGEKHKLIWGSNQKGSEKMQLFYNNVMNQIRLNTKDSDNSTPPKAVK